MTANVIGFVASQLGITAAEATKTVDAVWTAILREAPDELDNYVAVLDAWLHEDDDLGPDASGPDDDMTLCPCGSGLAHRPSKDPAIIFDSCVCDACDP